MDESRQLLLLPDSKVGQRRIPLSDEAMRVIRSLPAGTWLIPGRKPGTCMAHPWGMWQRVLERAGLPATVRLHDIRHTVGSLAHHAGLTQKQIQELLGHRQISTTERYVHGVRDGSTSPVEVIAGLMLSR